MTGKIIDDTLSQNVGRGVSMDIAQIFAKAKKTVLTTGGYDPTLSIETIDREYPPMFIPNPCLTWNDRTTEQKQKLLFFLGRDFARREYETADTIRKIILVTETWFVTDVKEENCHIAAGDHPEKREGINALELRVEEGKKLKQRMYMAEIIRHGDLIDIAPFGTIDEVQSSLLLVFLAGISSGIWNDVEFEQVVKRFKEVGEI